MSDYLLDFKALLNQVVVWAEYVSADDRNDPVYNADVPIAARSEGARKLVTNAEGDRIISSTRIFTTQQLSTDDLIDGRRVLQVVDMTDGEGNIIGYESLLQ